MKENSKFKINLSVRNGLLSYPRYITAGAVTVHTLPLQRDSWRKVVTGSKTLDGKQFALKLSWQHRFHILLIIPLRKLFHYKYNRFLSIFLSPDIFR